MGGDTENLVAWMKGFRNGHKMLERLRIRRIRESDIVKEISSFDLAFKSAIAIGPPKPITGLVDLQRKLSKARK
jgi:hypothetical protein